MRILLAVGAMVLASNVAWAQQGPQRPAAPSTPTDRASHFSSEDLAAALAKLPADRPSSSVRVFSLAPYNVNVERRQPVAQGASVHEANAELFYVIDGSATMLTGGSLVGETRNGNNRSAKTIEGGVRQKLGKGDFFVVPSGVPHQFVDVVDHITIMSLYLPNAK